MELGLSLMSQAVSKAAIPQPSGTDPLLAGPVPVSPTRRSWTSRRLDRRRSASPVQKACDSQENHDNTKINKFRRWLIDEVLRQRLAYEWSARRVCPLYGCFATHSSAYEAAVHIQECSFVSTYRYQCFYCNDFHSDPAHGWCKSAMNKCSNAIDKVKRVLSGRSSSSSSKYGKADDYSMNTEDNSMETTWISYQHLNLSNPQISELETIDNRHELSAVIDIQEAPGDQPLATPKLDSTCNEHELYRGDSSAVDKPVMLDFETESLVDAPPPPYAAETPASSSSHSTQAANEPIMASNSTDMSPMYSHANWSRAPTANSRSNSSDFFDAPSSPLSTETCAITGTVQCGSPTSICPPSSSSSNFSQEQTNWVAASFGSSSSGSSAQWSTYIDPLAGESQPAPPLTNINTVGDPWPQDGDLPLRAMDWSSTLHHETLNSQGDVSYYDLSAVQGSGQHGSRLMQPSYNIQMEGHVADYPFPSSSDNVGDLPIPEPYTTQTVHELAGSVPLLADFGPHAPSLTSADLMGQYQQMPAPARGAVVPQSSQQSQHAALQRSARRRHSNASRDSARRARVVLRDPPPIDFEGQELSHRDSSVGHRCHICGKSLAGQVNRHLEVHAKQRLGFFCGAPLQDGTRCLHKTTREAFRRQHRERKEHAAGYGWEAVVDAAEFRSSGARGDRQRAMSYGSERSF